VPYPEHAWKGQDSKAGSRAGRRTRTFDDISLYKVRPFMSFGKGRRRRRNL
jgi:hypothetical protein